MPRTALVERLDKGRRREKRCCRGVSLRDPSIWHHILPIRSLAVATTMRQASPNLLLVLASTCIGGAAGALATFALLDQPRSAPVQPSVSPPVEVQIAPIVGSMEALTEALHRLESRMDEALARPVSVPAASTGDREPLRQPIDTATGDGRAEEHSGANWVEVLDKSAARLLVERGLTPYDPGVAEPLTKAGTALRKADDEYYAAYRQLNEDVSNKLITGSLTECVADASASLTLEL